MTIDRDVRDCIFRALFALIFVGLGFEHLFSDDLLQDLMPSWMPYRFTTQSDDVVLFSFSDRPIQQVLQIWREERSA